MYFYKIKTSVLKYEEDIGLFINVIEFERNVTSTSSF